MEALDEIVSPVLEETTVDAIRNNPGLSTDSDSDNEVSSSYSYESSPVPLPGLYFDSFSYPVTPIVSSAGVVV